MSNRHEIVSPHHQLQRKRQKKVHDYSQKSIDDLKLIVVNPPPQLTDQEKSSIMTYSGSSSQDKIIDNSKKRILPHILKCWNGNKSSAHQSAHTLTPSELVALN